MNPWVSIWTRPRATIRAIVDGDPRRHVALLLCASSFVTAFQVMMAQGLGNRLGVPLLLVLSLAMSAVGLPLWYVIAAYGRWVGSLFDGAASSVEVRAATAWSGAPGLELVLVDWPLRLLMLGGDAFVPEAQAAAGLPAAVLGGLAVAGSVVSVWSLVIALKTFAEVHRFSVWRALLVGVVTTVLLAVVGAGLVIGVRSRAATWT